MASNQTSFRFVDAAYLVEYALTGFWVAAIVVAALRRCSRHVAAISHYGGRSIAENDDLKQDRGAKITTAFNFLWNHQVSRKWAFASFYIVGSLTSVAVFGACLLVWKSKMDRRMEHDNDKVFSFTVLVKLIPLVAFGLHCAVRLWETLTRQIFRSGGTDMVTVFAALSGSGFYVAASLSCVPWSAFADENLWTLLLETDEEVPAVILATSLFLFVHLLLQCVQVAHHELLRKLRLCKNRSASPSPSYRFPSRMGLFRYVQEPHYTMEILMYVTQWAFLRQCYTREVWQPLFPATLVTLFTLMNLGISAAEHRSYWNGVIHPSDRRGILPVWNLLPGLY